MTPSTRVLIVDDDAALLRTLAINLRARHYEVHTAATGAEALSQAARHLPEVIVLDLGLPDMDGTEVLLGLQGWCNAPVLVLSARDRQGDKVHALDLGAVDYVVKPFGMDELLARLRAAVRRTLPSQGAPVITTPDFTVDLAAKRVEAAGLEVSLTPTEWHLLEALARRPGHTVTHQQLLTEVWGVGYEKQQNYLRVYMAALRRKLEPDPAAPRYLITVTGLGYRFML